MAWRKSSPELIALFDRLLTASADIERRKMFGYPAAFTNGHLFASLYQEGMVLKLGEADRRALKEKHGASPFEPRPGRVMGAFMVVPPKLLSDAKALGPWLEKARAYVGSLPPKEAKTRKAAKKTQPSPGFAGGRKGGGRA